MGKTRNQVLEDAVNRALAGCGLRATCSGSEITMTDPLQAEMAASYLTTQTGTWPESA